MRDVIDSLVAIILQGCPFLVMTSTNTNKPEVSLAQRILLIMAAFLIAGAGAGLTVYLTMKDTQTVFGERQASVLVKNADQDARLGRLEEEVRSRTDDRYRASEAKRDFERVERQLAEMRERIVKMEVERAILHKK